MGQTILRRFEGIPRPDDADASLTVRVTRDSLDKLLSGHVSPRKDKGNKHPEPWHCLVPGDLLAVLRSCRRASELDGHSRKQFLDILESELQTATRHPLGLNLQLNRGDSQWLERWLFILPSGSVVVLQRHRATDGRREEELVTWFFHQKACLSPTAAERCRQSIRQYALRYCHSSNRRLRQPTDNVAVVSSGKDEIHSGFRFFSEASWGFDERGDWDTDGIPGYGSDEPDAPSYSAGFTLQISEGD